MKPLRVLVLDDEENIRKSLCSFLRMRGFQAEAAAAPSEAVKKLREEEFQVLITDVRMPEKDGIALTEELSREFPALTILVVTAYSNVRDAVAAMKKGAFDYLTKPLDQEELLLILQRVRERYGLIWEIEDLRRRVNTESPYQDLVGSSEAIRGVYALIERAARSDFSVLITGETGTGKDIVTRAIHHTSPRRDGPLVAVNCGALSETMMESELFGHLKGSFTGAAGDRLGKIRSADGGTLFLDEVDTLSPSAQVRLLRVLDERKFAPVGGDTPVAVDIRVVAATNEDLAAAVAAGRFREDLFYRLNVIQIPIPPLRERKEDIPLLARHIFAKLGREDMKISSGAMNLLLRYDWPGNIRELENAIKSMLALIPGDTLVLEQLPENIRGQLGGGRPFLTPEAPMGEQVELFEKHLIEEKLRQTGGNVTAASRALGFPLRSLRRKMDGYGLRARDFKS